MKLSLIICLIPTIAAFAPLQKPVHTATKLEATRREVLLGIAAATAAAQPALAKQAGIGSDWGFIEDEVVSAQQPTGDRVDVNNAAIVSESVCGQSSNWSCSIECSPALFHVVIEQSW